MTEKIKSWWTDNGVNVLSIVLTGLIAGGGAWISTREDIVRINAEQIANRAHTNRLQEVVDNQNKLLQDVARSQAVTVERLSGLALSVGQIHDYLTSKMVVYQKPVRKPKESNDSELN